MRKKEMIKRWIYGIVGSLVLCVGTVSAQRTLSLEECREMALENNAKMKNARLDVEEAKEKRRPLRNTSRMSAPWEQLLRRTTG